jgi:hypothetical protein
MEKNAANNLKLFQTKLSPITIGCFFFVVFGRDFNLEFGASQQRKD